jgi:hypothetical protein
MAAEFLPLCDVLFNVISLAGYFCDVVFDVVMSYALLERGYTATGATALSIIIFSLLISQVFAFSVSITKYIYIRWRFRWSLYGGITTCPRTEATMQRGTVADVTPRTSCIVCNWASSGVTLNCSFP